MADDLVDPQAVQVKATISFHEAINAVCLYAKKYPVERISQLQITILQDAVHTLAKRYIKNEKNKVSDG